jgi:hypothetical protein
MKSRLAASILCSFLYVNLGGRILLSTLLVVIVTAAAWAQTVPAVSPAEARKAIQARVAMDKTQSRGCWLRIYTSKLPTEN